MLVHLKSRGRALLLATAVCAAFGAPVLAAETLPDPIEVTIDFAKVVRLDTAADTIIVGNPGIFDASIDNEKTLILTGRTAGTTNLIVLDVDGKELIDTVVRVSSDVRQLTTVFYGAQRQSFSCAATCEQVISVGDNADAFDTAKTQIETRKQFSTAQ